MRNLKKRNILIVLALVYVFSVLINAIYTFSKPLTVSAHVNTSSGKITLDDEFEDDCVLVVLDESISLYNGIPKKISKRLSDIGAKEITDLSALPEEYLNADGTINAAAAPNLFKYYNENAFNQILRIDLETKGKKYVLEAIEKIAQIDGIVSVEPNMIISCGDATTDDTFLSDQWGLVDSNGIDIYNAWNITTGDKSVRVGVIDSGISTHVDLDENVATGYDFHNNNTLTTDDIGGHGTHVAGIIGAIGNNGRGISGVAQHVTLVPLQTAYDTSGSGSHYTEDVVDAIEYARDLWETNQRISILNYSISHFGKNTTVLKAVKNFPGLFVWAAGNLGEDVDAYENASEFNLPNLISVGAIDINGNRLSTENVKSNYGKDSVNIYAPGRSIYSTYTNNTYVKLSGTSMAAPHVTGVAALLLSRDPTLSAAELKQLILDGADEIPISTPEGPQNVKKLNAYNALRTIRYKVTFDKQGGQGGDDFVFATYGEKMPAATAPIRSGYGFAGYYTDNDVMYYDSNMKSVGVWNINEDTTLYAKWNQGEYTVTFKIEGDTDGEYTFTVKLKNGDKWPIIKMPTRTGYYVGQYWDYETDRAYYYSFKGGRPQYETFYSNKNMELVGTWLENNYYLHVTNKHSDMDTAKRVDIYPLKYHETITITANESMTSDSNNTKLFSYWSLLPDDINYDTDKHTVDKFSTERTITVNIAEIVDTYYPLLEDYGIIELRAVYEKSPPSGGSNSKCITEGTLITLANGEQVPVEQLTGDEMLLVWNLYTGTFDTAPILFIDHDDEGMYEVIKLSFSDGTTVEVIYEHAFWDFNLNKYVFLRSDADQYLGHWFNKQIIYEDGQMAWSKVQLTDVQVQQKYTSSWSPVTYGHLCYYVNGMLSMPGATEGLINIFEVDSQTIKYDEEKMLEDINEFGLFTYEEFAEILPVPEEIFNAFSGQYLKVAIGKGLVDFETLASLAERYQEFF